MIPYLFQGWMILGKLHSLGILAFFKMSPWYYLKLLSSDTKKQV